MSIYRTRNSDINVKSIKNSLSEILPNKTPQSIERNKFEQSQVLSIIKAINQLEQPAKEKHIRNIILGTYNDKSSMLFWSNLNKIQAESNPITCWKFLYVVHRLMRDAHSNVLLDSYKHKNELDSLSKLWIHLKVDYGQMISNYCNYLIFKLNFHQKYKSLPGNLIINEDHHQQKQQQKPDNLYTFILGSSNDNNMDNYFQFCCELFDYIDEILLLQNSIFVSIDRSRSNSMTDQGQCKLAPLILCIQESNQIYDFCVKFLFKLYETLPNDLLEGHRQRFLKQFKMLKDFYDTCKNLQYFKTLIQIPDLPANPPNFLVSNEFKTYVKPVVHVPEPEIDLSIDDDSQSSILVDFSDLQQEQSLATAPSPPQQRQPQIDLQPYLLEIDRLKNELDRLTLENELEIRGLKGRLKDLKDDLINTQHEMEQLKIKNNYLEEQLKTSQENEKAKEELELLEKKALTNEDKFNKMKELYNKLRQEHLTLLKQDSEIRKQLSSLQQTHTHITSVKKELEENLNLVEKEKSKIEGELNEKISEIKLIKADIDRNQNELVESKETFSKEINEFNLLKRQLEDELKETQKKIIEAANLKEKSDEKIHELENNLNKTSQEHNTVKALYENLSLDLKKQQEVFENSKIQHEVDKTEWKKSILESIIKKSIELIKETLNKYDDPILLCCKSGAEYMLSLIQPVQSALELLNTQFLIEKTSIDSNNLVNSIYYFTCLASELLLTGKITSLTAADLDKSNELCDLCKNIGDIIISLLSTIPIGDVNQYKSNLSELNDIKLKKLLDLVHELLPKIHDISKEEIGDLVEQEMHNTSQAIEDAVAKLSDLIIKSREKETGIKLEVNDKILDSCTDLMKAIKVLIIKSKELQKEICSQGRGTSTVKEFYAKNHKWTEGLVSAAKLVGLGASLLIEKADKLVNDSDSDTKMEEIIVCSHEIAASTTQLVVASRVKADSNSSNLKKLLDAKTHVTQLTGNLVASAKSCIQIIDDEQIMNNMDKSLNNLSFHQTKKLEMETQVRVLQLEKQLEQERLKLSKLRKQHYQSEN